MARAAVDTLTRRYRAVSWYTATDELAEIITSKRRTWQRWLDAMAAATGQVRVLNQPPFETESSDPFPAELQVLGKDIPVRVVYDDSGVRSPGSPAGRTPHVDHARVETHQIPGELAQLART